MFGAATVSIDEWTGEIGPMVWVCGVLGEPDVCAASGSGPGLPERYFAPGS